MTGRVKEKLIKAMQDFTVVKTETKNSNLRFGKVYKFNWNFFSVFDCMRMQTRKYEY